MNEHELAIPFDVRALHENAFLKLLKRIKQIIKRGVARIANIAISLIGLILLIPLSIVVYIQNIRNEDYGPIFYTQERIGKDGKIFKMYKYRTMTVDADEKLDEMLKDPKINEEHTKYRKIQNDPRLTKFGKWLSDTSLDEFPQFVNVLKGEMNIVGPRPYMPNEQERMGTYYKYIIQHKPGITGVYQISGREKIEFEDRLDMDVRYHYGKTLKMDLKIALITMLVTLRKKKTYNVGETALDSAGYVYRMLTLIVKRMIDIIGAIVGIILLVPITIGIWIGNRICKDNGPLFYSQERIGKDGKHFKMYKFRSMVVGAEQILEDLLKKDEAARAEYEEYKKLKDDPRITKVGHFIRKTSLDEFPQFINVLKGEMSLVGPRAYMVTEKEDMGDAYKNIVKFKPGITGLWQVSGRSETTFEERLDIDLDYYENYDLSMDVEILIKTVITVMKKEGAA